MNTKIKYLYRDGANYKCQNEVVLAGKFSPRDIALIKRTNDGEFFIPEQVELPLIRPDDDYDDGYDHCWAEIYPDTDITLTDEKPTEKITWKRFMVNYRNVERIGWYPDEFN